MSLPNTQLEPHTAKCPKHGKMYQLTPYTTMCAHPACLTTVIYTLGFRSPAIRMKWKLFERRGTQEDFIQFFLMRLVEIDRKGKTQYVNAQWVSWEMSHFMERRPLHVKGESCFPQPASSDEVPKTWNEALKEHFAQIDDTPDANPFDGVVYNEVADALLDAGQVTTLLQLRDDITPEDAWMVENAENKQTPNETQAHHDFAVGWFQTWANARG